MENGKKTSLFYKIFSLLSVVRGYNILVLVIAQYLASIYIFSPKKSIPSVLFDLHLFFVVFATVCVVGGGMGSRMCHFCSNRQSCGVASLH